MKSFSLRFALLTAAFLFMFASVAHAVGSSGFEVGMNSAKSLGRANAVTADPDEPAAVVFNPAGLTSLEGTQVGVSNTVVAIATDYQGRNGGLSEDVNQPVAYIPAFFISASTPIKDLKIGAGVNAPFGLETQYNSDGNFKYLGSYNQIKTVGYNASLAYKIKPGLSIGGGMTYLSTYLKQVGKVNDTFLSSASLPDAPYELDVEGDGYGYNLGVQINHHDKHYVGLFYRSQVRADLSGEFSINSHPAGVTTFVFGSTSSNMGADTDITLPGSATLAYKYQINEKWDVEADFTWTGWSSFDRVDINFERPNAILNGFEPVNEDFKDVFSLNIGTSYKLNEIWTISGGYYYYEMAANKANYNNAIPDGDRHALTMGVQFNQKNYSIGLSYAALFLPSVSIDNTQGAASNATVDGDYESFANVVTMDALYRF